MKNNEELEHKKKRLNMYYAAEEAILDGAQSYSLGSRSLTRANLSEIKTMIKELEKEIKTLQARAEGRKPRKAVGVIIRDF